MTEQNELKTMQEQITALEDRIRRLENIIEGSTNKKPGRKSKLSLEQKNEIINKHKQGIPYSALTKEYSVSKGTISGICHGYDSPITVSVVRKKG